MKMAQYAAEVIRAIGLVVLSLTCVTAFSQASVSSRKVEQWDVEEITLHSQASYQNPFKEVQLQGRFTSNGQSFAIPGFFDGKNTWRIRFMPQQQGSWKFTTVSNDAALNNQSGSFLVLPPSANNHGPVHVAKTYHFSYADHTPYFLLGTTLYNWLNRDEALQVETLKSLGKSPFNKVRFGLFPKWYEFNRVEPAKYPYVETAPLKFDLDRFNPEFFQHVEARIADLEKMGIQADVILFHPYDHLGFATMDAAHDDAYIEYVAARLSSFRNVWWTMANEYDLFDPQMILGQRRKDWDGMFRVLEKSDPYSHLRGIHNISTWYDHSKPWITHTIIQDGNGHPGRRLGEARAKYKKPAVVDEYGYEGNNGEGWGSLSAQEEVKRHWEITMQGGYASHGETFVHPGGVLWWASGGQLIGDSPQRLGFLKSVMTASPFQDLVASPGVAEGAEALSLKGQYYLLWVESPYTGPNDFTEVDLEGSGPYQVDLIDPWQMKTYKLGYVRGGMQAFRLMLAPSILRFTKANSADDKEIANNVQILLAKWIDDPNIEKAPDAVPIIVKPQHYSTEFTLGELLADPRTKALLDKYFPEIPRTGITPVFSLEQLSSHLTGDQAIKMAQLAEELKNIPVPVQ